MNNLKSNFTAVVALLFVGSLNFSAKTYAGTRDGGGGVGVRCMSGQSETIRLLDLYEAQIKGLRLVDEPKDAASATLLASDLMARHFWNVDSVPVDQLIARMNDSIFKPIFSGRPWLNFETQKTEAVQYVDALPLSSDIGSYRIPGNCELTQIAYYDDKSANLVIVKTSWDKLSLLDRAALAAHELLYLLERRHGLEGKQLMTSESSRELVGELFSYVGAASKFPRFAEWKCNDVNFGQDMSYFYIARMNDGTWGLSFSLMHGGESAFQIVSVIPGISIDNLLNVNKANATSMTVPVIFTGDSFAPMIYMSIVKAESGYPTIQFFEESSGIRFPIGPAKEFNCHR